MSNGPTVRLAVDTIGIQLTTVFEGYAYYVIAIYRANCDQESYQFVVKLGEPDEVSGKKKMMDFVAEITSQIEEDMSKETKII